MQLKHRDEINDKKKTAKKSQKEKPKRKTKRKQKNTKREIFFGILEAKRNLRKHNRNFFQTFVFLKEGKQDRKAKQR